MDSKGYSAGLSELRAVRDELKPLERELGQLQVKVDKLREHRAEKVRQLGGYEKATADRLAASAGLAVIDIVALMPSLGPQGAPEAPQGPTATETVTSDQPAAQAPAQPLKETAAAPADPHTADPAGAVARLRAATADSASDQEVLGEPGQAEIAPAPAAPGTGDSERVLPSIPEGAEGDRWFRAERDLASKRPNFKQATRGMAFLDTATGVLVWQGGTVRLDLGRASVAEIRV